MNFLHSQIGSAKDNAKSPIHNWYKFTAGFSHLFVDEIINQENLKSNKNISKIFDPFAGCGTTLVSSQKAGVSAIGNEGQKLMYDVIRAKLNWKLEKLDFEKYLDFIKNYIDDNYLSFDFQSRTHSLLKGLYKKDSLTKLYLIRDSISQISSYKYSLFFKLALSQTLHKVSINPIAVPYISRSKTLFKTDLALEIFESIARQMFKDTEEFYTYKKISKVFLHDSRIKNNEINDGECSTCITSPPYLNNLDYGEVSKVHTHFFEYTDSWNDITKKVRHKLVTGATTHYSESSFDLADYKKSQFYNNNKKIAENLIHTSSKIEEISKLRAGKKSFHILTLYYFRDMYNVLQEIRRVVKKTGKAFLILGDSAPYGIYIPTTKILGEISLNCGFKNFEIHKIRTRGTKWKSLRYRHSIELSENVLVLK